MEKKQRKLLLCIGVLSLIYFGIPLLLVYERQDSWNSILGIPSSFILSFLNFMYYDWDASLIAQIILFFVGWALFYLIARKLPYIVIFFLLLAIVEMTLSSLPGLNHFEFIARQCHMVINSDIPYNSPAVARKVIEYDIIITTFRCMAVLSIVIMLGLATYKLRSFYMKLTRGEVEKDISGNEINQ